MVLVVAISRNAASVPRLNRLLSEGNDTGAENSSFTTLFYINFVFFHHVQSQRRVRCEKVRDARK
jgi:hypothetical protein